MIEKIDRKQVFELYLSHVISEAREASKELLGSFLLEKRLQRRYIRTHILFVSQTEKFDVETEIETWFNIYTWMEDKKDELLHRLEVENDVMIVLYPRFVNFEEFESLSDVTKERLEKNRIVWYR